MTRERRDDEPPCVGDFAHELRIANSGIDLGPRGENLRVYNTWCPRCGWTRNETFPYAEEPIVRVYWWRWVQKGANPGE